MLYLVSTPIGNLADITFRAVDTLKACHYILCEDTRHSKRLLDHYQISTPLKSYHKFNEKSSIEPILSDLRDGKEIALISDAGTPGVSDPGMLLVKACVEEGFKVVPIPGACAAIAAVSTAGLDTDRFQFMGFLPKKRGELQTLLAEVFQYPGTTICYESPHRVRGLLELIVELCPERPLVLMRELTKKFEQRYCGSAGEILLMLGEGEVKGEIVLMVGAASEEEPSWEGLTIEAHVVQLKERFNVSLSEAIKIAAQQRGVPKNQIYKRFHSDNA